VPFTRDFKEANLAIDDQSIPHSTGYGTAMVLTAVLTDGAVTPAGVGLTGWGRPRLVEGADAEGRATLRLPRTFASLLHEVGLRSLYLTGGDGRIVRLRLMVSPEAR
jgi:hypothetical protein